MTDEKIEWTETELIDECRRRFGTDTSKWAFQCPKCDDIAVSSDFAPFAESGYGSDLLGQGCIGRYLGALSKQWKSSDDYRKNGGRGCDWAAFVCSGGRGSSLRRTAKRHRHSAWPLPTRPFRLEL